MSNARQLAANLPREGGLSNRNLIINGAMQVAQRGTSFTNITTNWGADRFIAYVNSMGTFDISNVSDAPSGFSNSIKWSCNTADAAPSGNDEAFIQTILEAQNLQHLNYGSSDAETITVSFWVKSSETGAFGLWLYAPDGVRAFDTSYTITSANTWEKKTVTINGDTSGLINNDNGAGLYIRWYMGAAAVGTMTSTWRTPADVAPTGGPNIQGAVGRTFYLTGVQLEVGDTATPFEHRSYGDELQRCQRYFQITSMGPYNAPMSDGYSRAYYNYPVRMRVAPSITFGTGGGGGLTSYVDGIYVAALNTGCSVGTGTKADAEL